eukprot:366223-Chlamydomonas_euryale.AAC.16
MLYDTCDKVLEPQLDSQLDHLLSLNCRSVSNWNDSVDHLAHPIVYTTVKVASLPGAIYTDFV